MEQSRDDNRTAVVRSSTALNLLADGNMIARRVLRDRGTPRNTMGTYEYNPVNEGAVEKRAGWASVRCRCRPCFPSGPNSMCAIRENTRRGLWITLYATARDNNRPRSLISPPSCNCSVPTCRISLVYTRRLYSAVAKLIPPNRFQAGIYIIINLKNFALCNHLFYCITDISNL